MRTHSSSWLIKVIFALIILSFVGFFGYSRMMKGRGGKDTAAIVNGTVITYGQYKISYENTQAYYNNIFKDKIPDGMKEQLKSTALYQLINQVLYNDLAEKLGINVTDLEIYEAIANDPNFQKDGQFDPLLYKNVFLPYFERRYSLNYETFLREGLLQEKVITFLGNQFIISEKEAKDEYDKANSLWSFERIKITEIPPEGVEYKTTAEDLANEVIVLAKNGSSRKLNNILKKHKIEKEKVTAVSINRKHRLAENEDNEFYEQLFTLTKEKTYHDKPLKSGTSWYIFKLTNIEKPTEEKWAEEKEGFLKSYTARMKQDNVRNWLDYMRKDAKIEDYILASEK